MPTFNCHFTAVKAAKIVSRRFSIKAPDQYEALDIIIKEIGFDEYGEMTHPRFQFGRTRDLKMSNQLRATIKGAGSGGD